MLDVMANALRAAERRAQLSSGRGMTGARESTHGAWFTSNMCRKLTSRKEGGTAPSEKGAA